MLNMPAFGPSGQARAYSSEISNDVPGNLNFQSLSSLFPAPPSPGRYSRPKERRAEEAVAKATEERRPEALTQKDSVPDKPFLPSALLSEKTEAQSNEKGIATSDTKPVVPNYQSIHRPGFRRVTIHGRDEKASGVDTSTAAPRDRREREPAGQAQRLAKSRSPKAPRVPQAVRRVAAPLATTAEESGSLGKIATDSNSDTKAWGLSQEDQRKLESVAATSVQPTTRKPSNDEEPKNTYESVLVAESVPVAKSVPLAEDVLAAKASPSLTHVRPSGEAHMVDVGDKPSTKRTAIAIAHVALNRDVYEQIEENNNKKGDVLGIARIAGIMAAKRTSDIIPLCHPLAISKAEVDVYLIPWREVKQNANYHYWGTHHPQGQLVAIRARVECVGPTGVEMEALMAVQGAALTVVDMCKAVSKRLTIDGAKVVYKAGGRSGVWVDEKWKKWIGGEDKFLENGELKEGVDTLLRSQQKESG
jgi:molybdenum cofactor biosynthesis protein MoaC